MQLRAPGSAKATCSRCHVLVPDSRLAGQTSRSSVIEQRHRDDQSGLWRHQLRLLCASTCGCQKTSLPHNRPSSLILGRPAACTSKTADLRHGPCLDTAALCRVRMQQTRPQAATAPAGHSARAMSSLPPLMQPGSSSLLWAKAWPLRYRTSLKVSSLDSRSRQMGSR